MRSKLIKLLRDLENESGFRNEYSKYSEVHNCSYEITESVDFPNFRLIGKEFNKRCPTTYGSLVLYSDTAIRAELVRMESDGLVLLGTQKAIIQGMPRPSNAAPDIENAESTTERVILTTQGKNAFRYFLHKITKEPVLFLFSSTALTISIASLYFGLASVDMAKTASIPESDARQEVILPLEEKYSCEFTSNVSYTECIIEMVDRAAAEREWKQLKLETIEHPQINTYDLVGELGEHQAKIKEWRVGFEEWRDAWCEANSAFVVGSGVPSAIAACKLKLEIQAIETLNKIHETNVLEIVGGSDGISDFEPTEADVDALVKTNKTERGCVWADDPACD